MVLCVEVNDGVGPLTREQATVSVRLERPARPTKARRGYKRSWGFLGVIWEEAAENDHEGAWSAVVERNKLETAVVDVGVEFVSVATFPT